MKLQRRVFNRSAQEDLKKERRIFEDAATNVSQPAVEKAKKLKLDIMVIEGDQIIRYNPATNSRENLGIVRRRKRLSTNLKFRIP